MASHYNVAPRYAGGSPAPVDEATARRVAAEEADSYHNTCAGIYGEEAQRKALAEGLAGIVELRLERADCWIVEDLITGDRFVRPFPRDNEKPLAMQRRHARLASKHGLPVRVHREGVTAP